MIEKTQKLIGLFLVAFSFAGVLFYGIHVDNEQSVVSGAIGMLLVGTLMYFLA